VPRFALSCPTEGQLYSRHVALNRRAESSCTRKAGDVRRLLNRMIRRLKQSCRGQNSAPHDQLFRGGQSMPLQMPLKGAARSTKDMRKLVGTEIPS
jgi:hypothetical protein